MQALSMGMEKVALTMVFGTHNYDDTKEMTNEI